MLLLFLYRFSLVTFIYIQCLVSFDHHVLQPKIRPTDKVRETITDLNVIRLLTGIVNYLRVVLKIPCDAVDTVLVHIHTEGNELITAETGDYRICREACTESIGDTLKRKVTLLMSKDIIHLLQIIHIDVSEECPVP